MVRARDRPEWSSLERAVHFLTGGSNTQGVRELAELSPSLECAAAEQRGTMEQIEAVRQKFRSTEQEFQSLCGGTRTPRARIGAAAHKCTGRP